MSDFRKAIITNEGAALLSGAIADRHQIEFVEMVIGSGSYTEEEKNFDALRAATTLKEKKQGVGFSSISRDGDTLCLKAFITNENVLNGYRISEIGITAKRHGIEEDAILYSVSVAEQADFLPDKNNPVEIIQEFYTMVSNVENVSMQVNMGSVALAEDLLDETDRAKHAEQDLKDAIDNNKKELHKVATSGSYSDLANRPASLPANGGTADAATKATQDGNGNNIAATYANKGMYGDTYISIKGTHSNVGEYGIAFGIGAKATGTGAQAFGNYPESTGNYSATFGSFSESTGNYSFAVGRQTSASGNCSFAEGESTVASNYASHVFGKYNKKLNVGGDSNTQVGDVLVVGNGTGYGALQSNALRVTYAGDVMGKKAFQSSGADYAEFLKEWWDVNPDNEDRIGYFVTVIDGLLYKANKGDCVVGITSGNPSIVGNADEDYYWRYERDEYNRIVMEDVPEMVQKIDDDGNPVFNEETHEPIMIETGKIIKNARMKLSKDYDPTKQESYIERKDRKEWDYVGMLGVLPVRDDGTCIAGQFCKCGVDGIATFAPERGFDTYMVIERITENVVSVILK